MGQREHENGETQNTGTSRGLGMENYIVDAWAFARSFKLAEKQVGFSRRSKDHISITISKDQYNEDTTNHGR